MRSSWTDANVLGGLLSSTKQYFVDIPSPPGSRREGLLPCCFSSLSWPSLRDKRRALGTCSRSGVIGAGSNFMPFRHCEVRQFSSEPRCDHRAPSLGCNLQIGSFDSFRRGLGPVAPCKQPRSTRKARRSCRCVLHRRGCCPEGTK